MKGQRQRHIGTKISFLSADRGKRGAVLTHD